MTAARVLDPAVLAGLSGLSVRVDAVVEGVLAGLHRSPFRGASSEFAEHKEYSAGDELRTILALMGCTVAYVEEGLAVTGPADGRLRGLELDLHDVGELTPAIAALCALAGTPSHLTGIGHIRGHETDRLAALARELGALGADVTGEPDGLLIRPATLHGGVFHTYADHRMAHAGVIIGAAVDGVLVENVATTSKTFTDFAPFWAALFAGSPEA